MAYVPDNKKGNKPVDPAVIQALMQQYGSGGQSQQMPNLNQLPGGLAFDPLAAMITAGGGSPSPMPQGLTGRGDSVSGNLIAPVPPDIAKPQAENAIARRLGKKDPNTAPVAEEFDNGTLDAINALMEMAGSVPSSGGGIDIAGIMKEAAGSAAKPFNAQIDTTRNQNQRAKADTKDSSKAVRRMYRALAQSNTRAAGRESEQATESAQNMQAMSQASADELAADNAARLNESAAQSAALGSGDLAATLATDVNANTSEGARQLAESAGTASTEMMNRGEAERRYLNRQGQNAKLTGTNRAADLFGDLQDYLQGNRDKIGELAGQRAAAVGEARSSAAAQAASAQAASAGQAQAAHQQMFENQMALLGMKTDLQQQDFDNNMSMEELGLAVQRMQMEGQPNQEDQLIPGYDNRMIEALPPEQRSALMLQQFLTPQSGQTLEELMQNPALRTGGFEGKDGQQMTIAGNPLNSEQLMAQLGLTSGDPKQNYLLSQIIAQLSSGNTDVPYGMQR